MNESHLSKIRTILTHVSRETMSPSSQTARLFSGEDCEDIIADLERYEQILRQWQSHINLIANATLTDIWQRHIIDSVQLFPLALSLAPTAANWLDVGSGGGFPALVLAILLKKKGAGFINLIESNGKKAGFLRHVTANLHLPAGIVKQRIEDSYEIIAPFPDIITARALADLPNLLTLIAPFYGAQTIALLQKGRGFLQEVKQAQKDWLFDLKYYPSLTDREAAILVVRNLRPL